MTSSRAAYPSDVSDEEWAPVAPDLTALREDAAQREYRWQSPSTWPQGERWYVHIVQAPNSTS